ncbi:MULTISPECIES: hypothetical protein [unclassified Streptomyces]|uniref:hypothetical protein n=1 Tax=unclassified Streptomyces TaxID=2593676 RepID=UPI0033AD509A
MAVTCLGCRGKESLRACRVSLRPAAGYQQVAQTALRGRVALLSRECEMPERCHSVFVVFQRYATQQASRFQVARLRKRSEWGSQLIKPCLRIAVPPLSGVQSPLSAAHNVT